MSTETAKAGFRRGTDPACCLMALSSLGRLAAQVQTEADKQPRAEERAQDEEYDSQSAMGYFSHWLTMPPLIDFPPVRRPAISPTPRQLKLSALRHFRY
jgi:hypothetical protein